MSNKTPRRAQRQKRPQTQSSSANYAPQPSGDDSEAPFVIAPTRKNTDLNLTVLKRHHPSITTILSIASSAVIYNFSPVEHQWDKAEVDGTMFVCQRTPSPSSGRDRYCLVVLNKRSLENLIVDMADVRDVEITAEFLILIWGEHGKEKTQGIFIQPDTQDTKDVNCRLIKECWESEAEGGNAIMDEQVSSYGEEVFS